jgi:hypothetical protein
VNVIQGRLKFSDSSLKPVPGVFGGGDPLFVFSPEIKTIPIPMSCAFYRHGAAMSSSP